MNVRASIGSNLFYIFWKLIIYIESNSSIISNTDLKGDIMNVIAFNSNHTVPDNHFNITIDKITSHATGNQCLFVLSVFEENLINTMKDTNQNEFDIIKHLLDETKSSESKTKILEKSPVLSFIYLDFCF